jgi:hypothetical protein
MKPIRFRGMHAIAERFVKDGDTVIEIWITDMLTTARAVATALLNNNNRKSESGIFYNNTQIHLNLATHYTLEVQRNSVPGIGIATRCRIILNQATGKANPNEPLYIVTPESVRNTEHAPPTFYGRLFGATKMPIKSEWADWLWTRGFEVPQTHKGRDLWSNALIEEIEGDDLFAYRITANVDKWLSIIRRHLDLVHHIRYNPSYTNRWRRTLDEERRAFAEGDPRFPRWRNQLADSKVTWVHDESGETVERGICERSSNIDYMILAAAQNAGIEAVIDHERS